MGKSIFSDNKIHINESLTTYRKRLFGKINTFKQQRNHKFLWTANGKILLRENETSRIVSFSTHEEFEDYLDEINNRLEFFFSTSDYSYLFIFLHFIQSPMNELQLIPCKFCHFYNLNDREFNIANGLRSVQFNQLIDTDLFNLISNPDKSDETDPDLMLTIPMSNYYSISQINNAIAKAGPKAISIISINMRSLQKNLALLEDFIYSLDKRPEILAITETRLNANSVCNVDLLNYELYHTDSPTSPGGSAIYIIKTLNPFYSQIKFVILLNVNHKISIMLVQRS